MLKIWNSKELSRSIFFFFLKTRILHLQKNLGSIHDKDFSRKTIYSKLLRFWIISQWREIKSIPLFLSDSIRERICDQTPIASTRRTFHWETQSSLQINKEAVTFQFHFQKVHYILQEWNTILLGMLSSYLVL